MIRVKIIENFDKNKFPYKIFFWTYKIFLKFFLSKNILFSSEKFNFDIKFYEILFGQLEVYQRLRKYKLSFFCLFSFIT